jgi:hypothetical protein
MITDIFKTSIYHTNVSNIAYKDYFINVLEKCMEEKKETIKSNNGGFQTSVLRFNNCNEIEKKLINDLIIYPCTDFLKQFNIKKPFKLDNLYLQSNIIYNDNLKINRIFTLNLCFSNTFHRCYFATQR